MRDILTSDGLDVFIDEKLASGTPLSRGLIEEMGRCRLMVAVYSDAYNRQWACQWEMIHAYLIGAAEGDPARRILIVNPETGTDHIAPNALADLKFIVPRELSQLVEHVRARLAPLTGPMSEVRRHDPPRWLPPRIPGDADYLAGRFPDLWRIHDALTAAERPMTVAAWSGPAALVTGMAGIGKTSVVRAYAWLFGDAYPGGVYWLDIEGAGGLDDARSRFLDQVRELARSLGLPVEGEPAERLPVLLADRADTDGAFLWVVDGLPADLDTGNLAAFTLPARHVRHIFTARRAGGGGSAARVPLDGLSAEDGLSILHAARPIADGDRETAGDIVQKVGGHPLALTVIGNRLAGRRGLVSYADFAATLTTADVGGNVLTAITSSMNDLGPAEHTVITLAGLLEPAPIPVRLIVDVLTGLSGRSGSPGLDADAVVDALDRLRRDGYASDADGHWRVHPLVCECATRLDRSPGPDPALATTLARRLVGAIRAVADIAESTQLVRHAAALADRPELAGGPGRDLADDLRRLAAAHAVRVGDPVRAFRLWREIAARHPDSVTDLIAAAHAAMDAGEFTLAAELAGAALALDPSGHEAVECRWALAASLDGLGRFDPAEPIWNELDRADWSPPPARQVALDVARARAKTARGRLAEAAAILQPLTERPDDALEIDQINAARIEFARVKLLTSAEVEGRRMAERVVSYYRARDAAAHARCGEAELVWAEAALALGLFELRPDTSKWGEAEATAQRLAGEFRDRYGPDSVHVLTARVQHGLILVHLGKQAECRRVLEPAAAEILHRLGARHPLYLRARYALGLAHLQLEEHAEAVATLGETWSTQRQVLGPAHPETLHSQLHYGVSLKYSDTRRSAEVLDDAWERLPTEVGWKNDLYGILWTERRLRPIMTPAVLTAFNAIERLRKKFTR